MSVELWLDQRDSNYNSARRRGVSQKKMAEQDAQFKTSIDQCQDLDCVQKAFFAETQNLIVLEKDANQSYPIPQISPAVTKSERLRVPAKIESDISSPPSAQKLNFFPELAGVAWWIIAMGILAVCIGLVITINLANAVIFPEKPGRHAGLSAQQIKVKQGIEGSGRGWGMVAGVVLALVAGIATCVYFGASPLILKYAAASAAMLMTAISSGLLVQRVHIGVSTSDAKCKKCGTEYSVIHTETDKNLISAIPRSTVVRQNLSSGSVEIRTTMWTEARYKIIRNFRCNACGSLTKKTSYQTATEDRKTISNIQR